MIIDFEKNNTKITEVIINDICDDYDDYNNKEFESFTIKTDLECYKLTAVGDCCSVSRFKEYKNYKFDDFIGIGKVIERIREVDIDDLIKNDCKNYFNGITKLIDFIDIIDFIDFKGFTEIDFNSYFDEIDKIIDDIEKFKIDDDFNNNIDTSQLLFNDCVSPHLYKISFKGSDEIFLFKLLNYSNGYYDGWIDIDVEK